MHLMSDTMWGQSNFASEIIDAVLIPNMESLHLQWLAEMQINPMQWWNKLNHKGFYWKALQVCDTFWHNGKQDMSFMIRLIFHIRIFQTFPSACIEYLLNHWGSMSALWTSLKTKVYIYHLRDSAVSFYYISPTSKW